MEVCVPAAPSRAHGSPDSTRATSAEHGFAMPVRRRSSHEVFDDAVRRIMASAGCVGRAITAQHASIRASCRRRPVAMGVTRPCFQPGCGLRPAPCRMRAAASMKARCAQHLVRREAPGSGAHPRGLACHLHAATSDVRVQASRRLHPLRHCSASSSTRPLWVVPR